MLVYCVTHLIFSIGDNSDIFHARVTSCPEFSRKNNVQPESPELFFSDQCLSRRTCYFWQLFIKWSFGYQIARVITFSHHFLSNLIWGEFLKREQILKERSLNYSLQPGKKCSRKWAHCHSPRTTVHKKVFKPLWLTKRHKFQRTNFSSSLTTPLR